MFVKTVYDVTRKRVMRVSLKQIAEMTGVSVSTVGRILSDPMHKCANEETRKKVLAAAREINYIPNAAARSLKSGVKDEQRIYSVDILLTRYSSESADPFYDELLMIAEKELRSKGCIVSGVWHQAELSDDKYSADIDTIVSGFYADRQQRSDGLIIIGKCTAKALRSLKKHEKNLIVISRNSTNYEVDEVICDGSRLAACAVSYLEKLGHTKIGYVGDCHNEARFSGYQSAMVKGHLTPDIDYIFDTVPNERSGYAAMEHFLRLPDPPTGIYCANDILAVGMLKCLRSHRSRGYEPSVISCDDIEEAQYTVPMLTTIALPKNEMVKFALMLLLDRINGGHKAVARIELEGTLVKRASCRPFRELSEPEYYI